ncbi:MAG: DUF1295 domain-containing protein [Gemmatimonadota bacterium]|nr:DUF1295 domain-containing protein [Gemmatimonadota bacterium]
MDWSAAVPLALSGLCLLLAVATLVWLVSVRVRDASIADIAWGPLFLVLAAFYGLLGDGYPPRAGLVVALVGLWAARLALHIGLRNRGEGEDPRYRRWRERDGTAFARRSLWRVFWLQAGIAWIVAAPLLPALASPEPARLTLLDGLGTAAWLVGFLFEVVGDEQLRRHRSDPARRGQVLRTGLWRYTRHPNYFGDALLWWGLWCFAAPVSGGAWTAVGPALMTFLLIRVSGVRLLESDLEERKPGYRDYVRRTNAFFPGPPRRAD